MAAVVITTSRGENCTASQDATPLFAGTRDACTAVASSGLRRLVLVSSLGVADFPHDDVVHRVLERFVIGGDDADVRVTEAEALSDDALAVTAVRAPGSRSAERAAPHRRPRPMSRRVGVASRARIWRTCCSTRR